MALTWDKQDQAVFGDGSISVFDVYGAIIFWNEQAVRVPVHSVETLPLIGMRLLAGYRLTIDVREDGAIEIEPLTD